MTFIQSKLIDLFGMWNDLILIHISFEKYSGSRNRYGNSHNDIDNDPISPSNYKQPSTPEHPPPTAKTAEKTILERIRPLSQVGE